MLDKISYEWASLRPSRYGQSTRTVSELRGQYCTQVTFSWAIWESMHSVSDALHDRAQAFVRAFESGSLMPEPFDALAVDIARHQVAQSASYARLAGRGALVSASWTLASDIPAVPTDAFKMGHVGCVTSEDAKYTFRTSGTTMGARGEHRFRRIDTYELGAMAFGRACLFRGLGDAVRTLVLGPSAPDAPDSSLTHMNALFEEEFGSVGPHPYYAREDRFDVARFVRDLSEPGFMDAPCIILATSFALVHLIDELRGKMLVLHPSSRVMQTGGYKGKSREVDAAELRAQVATCFGIPQRQVVSEYGMTELSSQFYERTAVAAYAQSGVYFEPPWARVVPVDPETLQPVADGEIGIARIVDLANVDSAVAVQTADRVRRVQGGFELLGRTPGAVPRGCSLAAEEMMQNARE